MEENELPTLITKLEEYSATNPAGYRLRVSLVAALGYAYLTGVVIALLGLVYVFLVYVRFSAVTVKLIWIPLVSSVICDFHLQHGRINRRNDKHIAPLLGELASNIKLDGPIVLVSLDLQRTLLSALQRVPGSTVFALEGVVEAEIERRH